MCIRDRAYTYTAAETNNPVFTAYGQVAGETWSWKTESSMGGKTMAMLVTITEQGGTAYGFKMEMSMDGGAPTTIMEGKATKSGT